ncbi:MAG: LptE family protein [Nitrospirota bacterium]
MKVQSSKFKVQNFLSSLLCTLHSLLFTLIKRYRDKNSSPAFPARPILILFIFHCSLFTLFGCGYTIHGKAALPFESIQIGKIENRTLEPKLQDKLYKALTEEFLKNGIAVYPDAGYKLSGMINIFELHILSERAGTAVEYEVNIKGDFRLIDPSGTIKDFRNIGSPFIVSFSGTGVLEEVIAFKEQASERAVKDMAMEIVAALIYR